ncbi:putative beta-lysine N-acetyltransferase [Malonomonas rubra]|uniref:putative beta-lysine N-acetyltransferase n=1 Tax=Malonomonas rubra TaxID=57040 RepID=UPI0026F1D6B8|nr:putative beta-lysine N-acetyltransferase [Malonomonas rubra]
MSVDRIEELGKSVVQHGPENERIYLMKLATEDMPEIISSMNDLAARHRYSKVFIKVPQSVKEAFETAGYKTEATVPNLFNGSETGLFMARYFDAKRQTDPDARLVRKVLDAAYVKAEQNHAVRLPEDCHCRLSSPAHCVQMAELYRQTFASYPFPIDDPEYLAKTMAKNVLYAGIWRGRQLLALASAEIDHQNSNAELTDFATDPDWRGHGLANLLLQHLEEELRLFEIKTSYTIARSTSYGMNICFAQNGYQFSGTLVKNTQIGGSLESMNVWHKSLAGEEE